MRISRIAGGAAGVRPAIGRYHSQQLGGDNLSRSDGHMVLLPWPLAITCTFDRIRVECTGAAAGSLVRLGIYAADADGGGKPSSLLLDAGTVDLSTTGLKDAIINHTLAAGMYWLAGAAQGGVASGNVRGQLGGLDGGEGPVAAGGDGGSWRVPSGVTGALPATLPGTLEPNDVHWQIMMRRA